jgi:hypothetical protein
MQCSITMTKCNLWQYEWTKERVKTSWGRDSMLLKDLLESRHHLRIYINKIKPFKEKFNAFWAYTKAWCHWKTYPILRGRIGLTWVKNHFEKGFNAFRAYTKAWCHWKTYPILRGRIRLTWVKNHFENMLAILRVQCLMDLHGV